MTKETLDGKIALVTDAGRNVGRGTTLPLAHAGVTIVVNGGSNRPAVENTVHTVKSLGVPARDFIADI